MTSLGARRCARLSTTRLYSCSYFQRGLGGSTEAFAPGWCWSPLLSLILERLNNIQPLSLMLRILHLDDTSISYLPVVFALTLTTLWFIFLLPPLQDYISARYRHAFPEGLPF
ncbi:hypothetical protein BU26DRAFT_263344 [Trematosphaeria pertusa]|uniref:Uncharacterized protein n=1 Tax=Trematosphaeria pertusa TaxID=390896 RepID=A0A6A6IRC6_9PLEO|nr:uncharacterized protein BU26DRAFT_263344 [Trematosphaeria pertusa]KAF2252727.1 hypothetical protein BU26DRAFT_263344 [Trematosphaeria pertusa]